MTAPAPGIVGKGLVVERHRRVVVEAASIHVEVGITAVIGPNGSGKSSLMRTLATVAPPAGGRLSIAGHDPATRRGLRGARRCLGYLPQAWDLPVGTRVIDALRHGAWLHRVGDVDAAVERALDDHALGDLRSEHLSRLSGGTHRRVAIAQATLHDPPVVLLDEPTAGLDLGQRDRLWRWLCLRSQEAAIVIITHDVEEVSAYADRAVVVADGAARALPVLDRAAVAAAVA
jgi:ABC-2 type transport system ATP-binding protein